MPWSSSAIVEAGGMSLLYYTVCYRSPRAELYNDGTLVTTIYPRECTTAGITNGGHVTVKFFDSSTDVYTFNKIVLKRDPYTAPDGSSKDVILTINIPGGKVKTAERAVFFSIKLTIATTSG